MKRALHLVNELSDVVQGKPWSEGPEIAGRYLESWTRGGNTSIRQPASQRFVDDVSEGPPGAARFRLELYRHIIVQGEGRSHVLMLQPRHHDVNRAAPRVRPGRGRQGAKRPHAGPAKHQ